MTNESETLIEELQRLRVDALYASKTHFNARERKSKAQRRWAVIAYVASAAAGSAFLVLLGDLDENLDSFLTVGGALLALIAAVSTWFQQHLSDDLQAHSRAADWLSAIARETRLTRTRSEAGRLTDADLDYELRRLSSEYRGAQQAGNVAGTARIDYDTAKDGLREGEASLEDWELKL